jgi:hypothetical protein
MRPLIALIALMLLRDFARAPWPFVALMVAATAMVLMEP